MTKTLSLPVCRKLSEMGIDVQSNHFYAKKVDGSYILYCRPRYDSMFDKEDMIPAYSLGELPAVLRAIGEKKNWSNDSFPVAPMPKDHFLSICELYVKSDSLGEGSVASKYFESLLEEK